MYLCNWVYLHTYFLSVLNIKIICLSSLIHKSAISIIIICYWPTTFGPLQLLISVRGIIKLLILFPLLMTTVRAIVVLYRLFHNPLPFSCLLVNCCVTPWCFNTYWLRFLTRFTFRLDSSTKLYINCKYFNKVFTSLILDCQYYFRYFISQWPNFGHFFFKEDVINLTHLTTFWSYDPQCVWIRRRSWKQCIALQAMF